MFTGFGGRIHYISSLNITPPRGDSLLNGPKGDVQNENGQYCVPCLEEPSFKMHSLKLRVKHISTVPTGQNDLWHGSKRPRFLLLENEHNHCTRPLKPMPRHAKTSKDHSPLLPAAECGCQTGFPVQAQEPCSDAKPNPPDNQPTQ